MAGMSVPALPPSSKYIQKAHEPVDDVEREAISKRLSDAYADGRVSQDDYLGAMDVVYGARTLGDLVPVMEKLPAAATDVPAIVGTGSVPAGQVNEGRNVLAPAFMATTAAISLLVLLGILLVILL